MCLSNFIYKSDFANFFILANAFLVLGTPSGCAGAFLGRRVRYWHKQPNNMIFIENSLAGKAGWKNSAQS
jgi:hypothetical protein